MEPRRIGLIGFGAIAKAAVEAVRRDPGCSDVAVTAVLLRPGSEPKGPLPTGCRVVHTVGELIDLAPCGIFECAGHEAVRSHGCAVLNAGRDLSLISIGALTDNALLGALKVAAASHGVRLSILAGAIPGIEALAAARLSGLEKVVHTVRKPPVAWRGTAAEENCALDSLEDATVIYEGTARDAAARFSTNANSTAAIALAGIGFEKTQTVLIADPKVTRNVHRLEAAGAFGSMTVEVAGCALPDRPRTSALAALSVARAMRIQCGAISI